MSSSPSKKTGSKNNFPDGEYHSGISGGSRTIVGSIATYSSFLVFTVVLGSLILELTLRWLRECPNREFLGWDPVSRFLVSLEMADAIRNFRIHVPLIKILDSPTWPALRSLPESLVILALGSDPLVSIYGNLLVLFGLGLTIWWVCKNAISRLTMNATLTQGYANKPVFLVLVSPWLSFSLAVLVVSYLLSIPDLVLYSFSGMLEIQGALFFLLVVEGLVLRSQKPWLLPIASFLLLQTKYPYAIMFLFAYGLLVPFLHRQEFARFLAFCYRKIPSHLHRNPLALFVPIPLTLWVLGKWELVPLPGKTPTQLIYLAALIALVDSVRFYRSHRKAMRRALPVIHKILVWVYFPTILWLSIHPDRFRATSNTISHEQGGGTASFYFQTLWSDLPYLDHLLAISLLTGSILLLAGRIRRANSPKTAENSLVQDTAFLRPILYLGIPLWILIGQSILTPNQQPRHIYHLYPTIYLGLFFLILWGIFQVANFLQKSNRMKAIVHPSIHLGILMVVSWVGGSQIGKILTEKPNVCYAGQNADIREYPLWIRRQLPEFLNRPFVLVNQVDDNHTNKPDTEMEFARYGYEKNIPYRIISSHPTRSNHKSGTIPKNWILVRTAFSCSTEQATQLAKQFFSAEEVRITTRTAQHIGCLEILQPKD